MSIPRPRPAPVLIAAVYTPLAAYLFQSVQRSGDGAAYVLQAAAGDPLDRPVHAGWLLPLSLGVRLGAAVGGSPSAVANGASAAAGLGCLLLIWWLGRELAAAAGLRAAARWALLAPGVAMASASLWDAALFCEIYGPLSLAVLGAVALARSGRPVAAGCAFGIAVAIHPGAVALAPGLLVLGWSGTARDLALVTASVLATGLWALLLGADGWAGPRGILGASLDRSPWESLQAAWRLLSRDLGLSALPVLIGAAAAARPDEGRRWTVGVLLCVLGGALALDRTSDNPGQLAALLLACVLAPLAMTRVAPRHRRALGLALGALLILGIAEATTRHDRLARRAVHAHAERQETCAGPPPGAWAEGQLWALACRSGPASR